MPRCMRKRRVTRIGVQLLLGIGSTPATVSEFQQHACQFISLLIEAIALHVLGGGTPSFFDLERDGLAQDFISVWGTDLTTDVAKRL